MQVYRLLYLMGVYVSLNTFSVMFDVNIRGLRGYIRGLGGIGQHV